MTSAGRGPPRLGSVALSYITLSAVAGMFSPLSARLFVPAVVGYTMTLSAAALIAWVPCYFALRLCGRMFRFGAVLSSNLMAGVAGAVPLIVATAAGVWRMPLLAVVLSFVAMLGSVALLRDPDGRRVGPVVGMLWSVLLVGGQWLFSRVLAS